MSCFFGQKAPAQNQTRLQIANRNNLLPREHSVTITGLITQRSKIFEKEFLVLSKYQKFVQLVLTSSTVYILLVCGGVFIGHDLKNEPKYAYIIMALLSILLLVGLFLIHRATVRLVNFLGWKSKEIAMETNFLAKEIKQIKNQFFVNNQGAINPTGGDSIETRGEGYERVFAIEGSIEANKMKALAFYWNCMMGTSACFLIIIGTVGFSILWTVAGGGGGGKK